VFTHSLVQDNEQAFNYDGITLLPVSYAEIRTTIAVGTQVMWGNRGIGARGQRVIGEVILRDFWGDILRVAQSDYEQSRTPGKVFTIAKRSVSF